MTVCPKGTWDGGKWGVTGVFDYQDLLENILTKSSAVQAFDGGAQVPTATWNLGKNKGLGFITYGDESVGHKTDYVPDFDLGGVMFWEFSGDIENDPRSLVRAMYCGLNPDYMECQALCQ